MRATMEFYENPIESKLCYPWLGHILFARLYEQFFKIPYLFIEINGDILTVIRLKVPLENGINFEN